MKKIPCLFERDFHGHSRFTLRPDVTPGCEWVLAGEGIATIKRDGTACAVIGGELYARYDAKHGKAPPQGAIPCGEPDPVTGHWPHWIKVGDEPQFKWHREAWSRLPPPVDGTYELCGPKLQGNPERFSLHGLWKHGAEVARGVVRTFAGIRDWLCLNYCEGIVFHHPDGRMAKIRRVDFGFGWGSKPSKPATYARLDVYVNDVKMEAA